MQVNGHASATTELENLLTHKTQIYLSVPQQSSTHIFIHFHIII
jgi:hypothetical protein